jgi:hypothetical protein
MRDENRAGSGTVLMNGPELCCRVQKIINFIVSPTSDNAFQSNQGTGRCENDSRPVTTLRILFH